MKLFLHLIKYDTGKHEADHSPPTRAEIKKLGYMHTCSQYLIEVSVQHHTLSSLPLQKELWKPADRSGGPSEQIWMLWRREKSALDCN
jgi:hypothetical protein